MKNNIQGYTVLLELEIALREYLIARFSESDFDIFNDVLNQKQQEILLTFKKSLLNRKQPHNIKKVVDRSADEKKNYNANKLWHPFYYLDFTDLEAIFLNPKLSNFFDSLNLFKKKRLLIASEITFIKPIRNDLAHAKLITESELDLIKLSSEKIFNTIPNIKKSIPSQTVELNIATIYKSFQKDFLNFLSSGLDKTKYDFLILSLDDLLKSFWIRYFSNTLFMEIKKLNEELIILDKLFGKAGYILKKKSWLKKNRVLLDSIKSFDINM